MPPRPIFLKRGTTYMGFLKIIIILLVIIFVLLIVRIMMQSKRTAAQFELPEDTDKEYFVDPKNGKKYDREAYLKYMGRTAQGLSVAQLQNMIRQREGRGDIWNELMCEAMRAELERRDTAAEQAEEIAEDREEEISEDIEPFFWVEQSVGASVGLTTGEYLQELFDARGVDGIGKDWDMVAKTYLNDQSNLRGSIQFDSQEDMFCAYSRDAAALKKFIYGFYAVCEDREKAEALFKRVKFDD